VEVHARSIFLQGLLLVDPEHLPSGLKPYRPVLDSVVRYAELHGLSRMALALAFGMQHPDIDVALVGVSALREFEEVLQITRHPPVDLDFGGLGSSDEALLNPARWVTA
jgi:aryl-alcohol dehydrogenase-like predicted oxidoreductase